MSRAWYAYDGVGDPYVFSSYSLTTVNIGCVNGNDPCAIYVYNGDIDPVQPFSVNIQHYISNLLITGIAQPQIGSKRYVYGKK